MTRGRGSDGTVNDEALLAGLHDLAADLGQMTESLDRQGTAGSAWQRKDTAFDIFSPADAYVEERIAALLADRFPTDGVLGEEGLRRAGTSGRTWIVDPIDGTVNYVKGDRTWGISVARCADDVVDCAVVLFPQLATVAVAVRGLGAFVNGRRLDAPILRDTSDLVIATKFGNSAARRRDHASLVGMLLADVRDIRRSGCSSWDILQVALGVWDGYLGSDVYLWDYAGSALVLEEVGGRWSEPMGRAGYCSGVVVAAMGPVHDWLLTSLDEASARQDHSFSSLVER